MQTYDVAGIFAFLLVYLLTSTRFVEHIVVKVGGKSYRAEFNCWVGADSYSPLVLEGSMYFDMLIY